MLDKHWLKSLFIIFLVQILFVVLFALVLYYTKGKMASTSVILGGLVYCVPALLSGWFMSKASNTSAALVLVKAYLGTVYKMIITICLFIFVFKHVPISIGLFLSAYLLAFAAQYITSYVLYKHN